MIDRRVLQFSLPSALLGALLLAAPAIADTFHFETAGAPDGRMGVASRPASPGKIEIEAADDFVVTSTTRINQATFYGLVPSATYPGNIAGVTVKIYRVFPLDSTSPPSGNVPSRAGSPGDAAIETRSSAAATLTFSSVVPGPGVGAANSVLNGIHPMPNQTTGGEGPVGGALAVGFRAEFTSPIVLPAGHYFFVPQVQVTGGDFYWSSSAFPPAIPLPPVTDEEMWVRDGNLSPDWLRVGTDIVGGASPPAFEGVFSLDGDTDFDPSVPTLSTWGLIGLSLLLAGVAVFRLRALTSPAPCSDRRRGSRN
jgi:hypothetical protein